jgi:prenyltransferase beta subunit
MEAPPVPSEGASASSSPTFFEALHAKHIHNVAKVMAPRSDTESALQSVDHTNIEFMFMEYMFLEGVYWGLTALEIMGRGDEMDKPALVKMVLQCQHESGGFGGNIDHDPSMVYTRAAIYVLALCDGLEHVDADKVAGYITSLQNEDGSFAGDQWGEVDTRFSFSALSALAILKRLDAVDVDKACLYVAKCKNFDGGFGFKIEGESHGAAVFTGVGTLAIGQSLHYCDQVRPSFLPPSFLPSVRPSHRCFLSFLSFLLPSPVFPSALPSLPSFLSPFFSSFHPSFLTPSFSPLSTL